MDSHSASRIWMMRASFAMLAFVIIFFHLIPLDTVPRRWAPPDLIIAFAFAWVMRRPDYLPPLLLAGVMLMADLMFQRPPGLLAVLVVMGAEYLRTRTIGLSEASFVGEWLAVAIVMIGITVIYRIVLSVMAVDQASLGLSLIQMVLTIVIYPLVVLISQAVMKVRKIAPGDSDALGGRA